MQGQAWFFGRGGGTCLVVLGLFGCSATAGGTGSNGSGAQQGHAAASSGGGQPQFGDLSGTGSNLAFCGDLAGGGQPTGCNDLTVETQEVTPTVLLLVDNSSSMFEPREQLWDPLYGVLMKNGDGIVASLQNKVRFGFTSFRGSKIVNDPACPNLFEVDYALDNYAAIDALYAAQGREWQAGDKWETPTGAAIRKAAEKLALYQADPPGPKFIVLVTDGNPNTCGALDPQCGSDESIKAVQDAKAMGIGTFAVGIGDIVATNTGCEPGWGRCGALHLQDLANAGQGLPVQAPPDALKYQACTPTQKLAASYAAVGEPAVNAPYYTATSASELQTALTGLLSSVVSCTYDMNAKVVGNAARGTVKVNGVAVAYDDPNGWKLEDNQVQITLQGSACETFKAQPGSTLYVSFPCKVAVPK